MQFKAHLNGKGYKKVLNVAFDVSFIMQPSNHYKANIYLFNWIVCNDCNLRIFLSSLQSNLRMQSVRRVNCISTHLVEAETMKYVLGDKEDRAIRCEYHHKPVQSLKN